MKKLSPVIRDFISEFESAKSKVKELDSNYSSSDFNKKPAPDKWCAGECIEHLNKAGNEYLDKVEKALDESSPAQNPPQAYKPRFIASKFIDMMKPEHRMNYKAPKIFLSEYAQDINNTIERFLRLQDRYIAAAEKSNNYDLNKVKAPSPVSNILKFQLGEIFMAMIEHQKRHLKQAEEALRN